jgi:hypothetical protein
MGKGVGGGGVSGVEDSAGGGGLSHVSCALGPAVCLVHLWFHHFFLKT